MNRNPLEAQWKQERYGDAREVAVEETGELDRRVTGGASEAVGR